MENQKTNKRKLRKAGLEHVRDGMWVRGDFDALKRRIAETDLFVSDFDECLLPCITQAEVGMEIFRRVASSLGEPGHLPLFLNMCRGAAPIIMIKTYQKATGDIQNSRMILSFEKLARGLPIEYFHDAIKSLSGRFFPGVPDTLRLLSAHGIPSGIVSLGLDIIIGGMLKDLEKNGSAGFDFFECTAVEADSRGRFLRYSPEKVYTENEDKRGMLRSRAEEYNARRVLVVGHDRDDLMMFDEAKRLGGIALGFRPVPEALPLLDAAIFARDWRPVHELLRISFEEGAGNEG